MYGPERTLSEFGATPPTLLFNWSNSCVCAVTASRGVTRTLRATMQETMKGPPAPVPGSLSQNQALYSHCRALYCGPTAGPFHVFCSRTPSCMVAYLGFFLCVQPAIVGGECILIRGGTYKMCMLLQEPSNAIPLSTTLYPLHISEPLTHPQHTFVPLCTSLHLLKIPLQLPASPQHSSAPPHTSTLPRILFIPQYASISPANHCNPQHTSAPHPPHTHINLCIPQHTSTPPAHLCTLLHISAPPHLCTHPPHIHLHLCIPPAHHCTPQQVNLAPHTPLRPLSHGADLSAESACSVGDFSSDYC